ncbi:MAG: hypothetical protein MI923_19490 [Phycisphaerales bacterium]|nr:hypothetical protein [Phycisphaerales bacterium]
MTKARRRLLHWSRILPALVLYQSLGCLPDNAVAQVAGENIVLTSAVVIQSVTAIVFNSLFGSFTSLFGLQVV